MRDPNTACISKTEIFLFYLKIFLFIDETHAHTHVELLFHLVMHSEVVSCIVRALTGDSLTQVD